MKVNSGNDLQALVMAGQTALAGTATAATATTLTSSGFTSGAYVGQIVLAGSTAANFVYGVIVSNTTTVLTVDRWYNPASIGGAVGTTPAATAPFIILPGGDAYPVTIAKIGVFNSLTSGTMLYETALSATATLSASGDALTTTHTVTT
jgi:hypothetical protein